MKRMKKLVCMLLSVVMVLALSLTGFAEDDLKVKIKNVKVGDTYNFYKIFDLKVSADGDAYDYEVNQKFVSFFEEEFELNSEDSDFNKSVRDKMAQYSGNSEELYNLSVGLAKEASTLTANKSITVTAENIKEEIDPSTQVKINYVEDDFSELGYYLMVPEGTGISAIFSLDTVTPNVDIENKSTYPTITKEVNDQYVEVGQSVNFTIKGQVPETAGYTDYVYTVSDTMSAGLTYNVGTLTVQIGDQILSAKEEGKAGEYILDVSGSTELTVQIKNMEKYPVGDEIKIQYTATVNKTAIADSTDELRNTAILEYSNNPSTNSTAKTVPVDVKLYTFEIDVTKYAASKSTASNAKKTLAGAEFKLYKMVKGSREYLNINETTKYVTWVDEAAASSFVTVNGGKFRLPIKGIQNGDYYLEETKAPAGYNLLTDDVKVTVKINEENAGNPVYMYKTVVDVTNTTGTELPSTGGIGTTIFTVAGIILMAGVAVVFVTRKRMGSEL